MSADHIMPDNTYQRYCQHYGNRRALPYIMVRQWATRASPCAPKGQHREGMQTRRVPLSNAMERIPGEKRNQNCFGNVQLKARHLCESGENICKGLPFLDHILDYHADVIRK